MTTIKFKIILVLLIRIFDGMLSFQPGMLHVIMSLTRLLSWLIFSGGSIYIFLMNRTLVQPIYLYGLRRFAPYDTNSQCPYLISSLPIDAFRTLPTPPWPFRIAILWWQPTWSHHLHLCQSITYVSTLRLPLMSLSLPFCCGGQFWSDQSTALYSLCRTHQLTHFKIL